MGKRQCHMTSTWSFIARHGVSEEVLVAPGLVESGGGAKGCHYSQSRLHVISLGNHARHWIERGSQVQRTTFMG